MSIRVYSWKWFKKCYKDQYQKCLFLYATTIYEQWFLSIKIYKQEHIIGVEQQAGLFRHGHGYYLLIVILKESEKSNDPTFLYMVLQFTYIKHLHIQTVDASYQSIKPELF